MATIRELEQKIRAQKQELTRKDSVLKERSSALDVMYWVWCDGGCTGGVNRYDLVPPLTEEIVQTAERNTARLRRWHDNVTFRKRMRELSEIHKDVHSLALWYLVHMEHGTFERIMSEAWHPKDPDMIKQAKELYEGMKNEY
ncbi:hypothetical protein M0R04_16335 [Candidatus Dojkabacteria bacterium]|jgi:hypothetical protein|nr:hypothetical protein [Candidatus Dojkabacteria bacterium]